MGAQKVAQVYVFDGDEYLGWDCFDKGVILVGSGEEADLVLPDPLIGATQASIRVNGVGVVLEDLGSGGAVCVNGRPVKSWKLSPLDAITVGRFTLKVRAKPVRQPSSEAILPDAAEKPPSEAPTVPPVSALPEEGLLLPEADDLCRRLATADSRAAFETLFEGLMQACEAGAVPTARPELPLIALGNDLAGPDIEGAQESRPHPETSLPAASVSPAEPQAALAVETQAHEVEAEPGSLEGSGCEAPAAGVATQASEAEFPAGAEAAPATPVAATGLEETREAAPAGVAEKARDWDGRVLEVIRVRDGSLVEVRHLEPNESYEIEGDRGSIPVAARDGAGEPWFFADGCRLRACTVARNGRLVPVDAESGTCGRYAMPARGRVVVGDGLEEFVLRVVRRPGPAEAPPPPAFMRFLKRCLAASSVLHLVLLFAGGLTSVMGPFDRPAPKTVVVELEAPARSPEPPLAKPTPARPLPALPPTREAPRVAAAPRAVSPQHTPVPESVRTAEPSGSATAQAPEASSAAPEAAAHATEAAPRNVRQTGILKALGVPKGLGLGPSMAMAAAGDVSTVPTADAGESGVKVAALVTKLGKTRIGLPPSGPVGTKGGSQVLGAGGAGSSTGTVVGALEKGQTGQRQVKAMVSADLKHTATVQGGMSREEVKKVIDQHMDEVSYCYETSLVESPSLMGKITFEWRILTPGTVGEVLIQTSSIKSDSLHSCIKRAIKSWQFPKPRGAEVIVSYPFIFDVVGF